MAKQNVSSPETTLKRIESGGTVTIKPASAKVLLKSMKEMRAALLEGESIAYEVSSEAAYAGFAKLRKKSDVFILNAIKAGEFMKGVK